MKTPGIMGSPDKELLGRNSSIHVINGRVVERRPSLDFRKTSYENVILSPLDGVTSLVDEGDAVALVYLDFCKGFLTRSLVIFSWLVDRLDL